MADNQIGDESPEGAFSLVANETRFGILQALWEDDETPSSFSDLRDRVGMRDSGKFNYHLNKLIPEFVLRVDEGYELTYAGRQIIGAAVSGTYTHTDITVEPIEVSDCPSCESTIEASYERGFMRIKCSNCGMVITNALPAPPILAANHDTEDLPQVFSRLLVTQAQAEDRGFCHLCRGPMEKSLDPKRDTFEQPSLSDHLAVEVTCRACGNESYHVVGWAVIDHPAVVSFLYDHGIDIRETPVWELYTEWLSKPHATVVSEDPLRIETSIELDDDHLVLTLDEDLTVLSHDRE